MEIDVHHRFANHDRRVSEGCGRVYLGVSVAGCNLGVSVAGCNLGVSIAVYKDRLGFTVEVVQ